MPARTDLSFDEFIAFQFGPAVRMHGNPWYFDLDADRWEPEPRTGISYLTRLFAEGPQVLEYFSDAQIEQGLSGLVNTAAVGGLPWMFDRATPAVERAGVWHAVARFFEDVLAPRCSPALGHLSEEGRPLNGRTYMWWDGFPALTTPDDPDRKIVDEAELGCLKRVLALDSAACQEAALHGLGHWVSREPLCGPIIDDYLARDRIARPELATYARAARTGCIL
jgi:hypothetical protein